MAIPVMPIFFPQSINLIKSLFYSKVKHLFDETPVFTTVQDQKICGRNSMSTIFL